MILTLRVRVGLLDGARFLFLANTGSSNVTLRPMGGLFGIAHGKK
tara:strand:- start:1217 stop:1351 length:135 start_codon:yes stop_codon:yes gene_type:complete